MRKLSANSVKASPHDTSELVVDFFVTSPRACLRLVTDKPRGSYVDVTDLLRTYGPVCDSLQARGDLRIFESSCHIKVICGVGDNA